MAARRVLITGANGFVGRHLIARLIEEIPDVAIIAAVRPEEASDPGIAPSQAGWTGLASDRVTVAPLEVVSASEAASVIVETRPEWIVHLAARSSSADTDRTAITQVNVEGTRNVLEAAAQLSPFPRVVVVSTGYVYGNTDPLRPAREEDPVGPLWGLGPYADSKIEMESVARNYRGFVVIARPFAHTGPGQTPAFAVPGFAKQLVRIEAGLEAPVIRVGNLAARRDLLDVRDVVRAYLRLLECGMPGETYNVASGTPVAIGEVLDRMRALCRIETSVERDETRMRPADIACSTGDPLKLWSTADWSPRLTLDTTLRDTLDYWRASIAP